jgi:hypothetical protein
VPNNILTLTERYGAQDRQEMLTAHVQEVVQEARGQVGVEARYAHRCAPAQKQNSQIGQSKIVVVPDGSRERFDDYDIERGLYQCVAKSVERRSYGQYGKVAIVSQYDTCQAASRQSCN